MIGDAGQDVREIGLRIEAVELCSLDQRQDRGSAFAAFVRASEQPVLTAERNRPDRPFGRIVVDLDSAVIQETAERFPTGKRISDRFRHPGFLRQALEIVVQLGPQGFDPGSAAMLPHRFPHVWWLPTDRLLYVVEFTDPPQRFLCNRCFARRRQIEELASGLMVWTPPSAGASLER